MELILASQSPARLKVLRNAGLDPQVKVSGIDEDSFEAESTSELVEALARAKAEHVFGDSSDDASPGTSRIIVGCDSLLEVDSVPVGKPGSVDAVVQRWVEIRGRRGTLVTGHHVILEKDGIVNRRTESATTGLEFADLSDEEIAAYAATGEPEVVAGGFTIDGLGGAFIRRIEGDPHNVIGISLPLLRDMLGDMGISWPSLWAPASLD